MALWKMVLLTLACLAMGIAGQVGREMYTRHNQQHWHLEQALAQQEAINRELVAVINKLAAKVGGLP